MKERLKKFWIVFVAIFLYVILIVLSPIWLILWITTGISFAEVWHVHMRTHNLW